MHSSIVVKCLSIEDASDLWVNLSCYFTSFMMDKLPSDWLIISRQILFLYSFPCQEMGYYEMRLNWETATECTRCMWGLNFWLEMGGIQKVIRKSIPWRLEDPEVPLNSSLRYNWKPVYAVALWIPIWRWYAFTQSQSIWSGLGLAYLARTRGSMNLHV